MKRRDLLKTASIIAAAPVFTSWTNGFSGNENYQSHNGTNQIQRFGDGRDWFLSGDMACLSTGVCIQYPDGTNNTSGAAERREANM
jgi:hypothetical protein